jgi:hypothetical protein
MFLYTLVDSCVYLAANGTQQPAVGGSEAWSPVAIDHA